MFTDRDGKFSWQLWQRAVLTSGTNHTIHVDGRSASSVCGVTGIERIVQRSAELTKQDPNGDARAQGGIDLMTIQKYINRWFSFSLDLFGGENSSNAAEFSPQA